MVVGFLLFLTACTTESTLEGQGAESSSGTAGATATTISDVPDAPSPTDPVAETVTSIAADPCDASISDPGPDAVKADLDGDGQQDQVWIEDQTAVAALDDGRSIQTPLDPQYGVASLGIGLDTGSDSVAVNLDDEPGDELLLTVEPNNWWGVVILDFDGCALQYVPLNRGGEIYVEALPLGTSSQSCGGLCTFSLECLPEVGLRHTTGSPILPGEGASGDEENGAVTPDEPMEWSTTVWLMVEGQLQLEDEEAGNATAADIDRIPQLTTGVACPPNTP